MDIKKKCQSHLWLLTGTGEGHLFTEFLIKEGWQITVSVVSQRASIPYEKFSLENILIGALSSEDEIRNIILNARNNHNGFHCVIDLTHPFAVKITPLLSKVCKELDQPFIRYERPVDNPSNAFLIKSYSDLANYDLVNKSILLAIGVRELQEAMTVVKDLGAKAYTRILANPDSIKRTLCSSILNQDFAVLNPSLSSEGEIEKALIRKWCINGVVCRQSGGVTEILWNRICSSMGLNLWMLARPSYPGLTESIDTYEKINKRLKSININ